MSSFLRQPVLQGFARFFGASMSSFCPRRGSSPRRCLQHRLPAVFTHSSKRPAKASARKSLKNDEESRTATACVSTVTTTMEEVEAPEPQLQQQPWQEALRKRSIRHLRGEHQSRFATHDTVGWTCPLCAFGLEFRMVKTHPKREKTLQKVWTGKRAHLTAHHPEQREALALPAVK